MFLSTTMVMSAANPALGLAEIFVTLYGFDDRKRPA
jgi:hypothetical protein